MSMQGGEGLVLLGQCQRMSAIQDLTAKPLHPDPLRKTIRLPMTKNLRHPTNDGARVKVENTQSGTH